MQLNETRADAARPDVIASAEAPRPVDEHQSWLARLVTGALVEEALFLDLRLSESDVQRDLTYGCD